MRPKAINRLSAMTVPPFQRQYRAEQVSSSAGLLSDCADSDEGRIGLLPTQTIPVVVKISKALLTVREAHESACAHG